MGERTGQSGGGGIARVAAFAAGDVLDRRYRLVSRLGRGGFGDVWRAAELLPDGASFREVALKLLSGAGDDVVDWAEEAKLLASFRHPSLVTIYAAGALEIAGEPQRFVAMELLEGQTLADVVRERGRIPWRRVLRWACNTAAALDVIHKGGVVHLDLKPANLFLSNDGALKVLDFGIARRAGGRPTMVPNRPRAAAPDATAPMGARTAPKPVPRAPEGEIGTAMFLAQQDALSATQGMLAATQAAGAGGPTQHTVIGTPGYMAPEVLELAEPTAAADAYALAVCVVQLATGHLPHEVADEPASWDDPTVVSAWLDELRRATLRGALRGFDADPQLFPRGLAAAVRRLLALDPVLRGVVPGRLAEMLEEVWQRPHGVPDPPYLGLAPYPPEAEGVLFGRDDDIARLGRELEYEPGVVLQGARGVGKSSLALAGLVPYLALRGVDGKDDWIAVRVVPGDDPDQALADALGAIDPSLRLGSAADLAAHCERSAVGVALVVDPLEDVLTAPLEKRTRFKALVGAIAEATPILDREDDDAAPPSVRGDLPAPRLRAASPGLRVIAALAEERTAALLETRLGAALRASLRFVGAPATTAVRDIVGAPAHFAGVAMAGVEDIAAEVQRELRAGADRLPYVSLALRAFWLSASAPRPEGAPPSSLGAQPPLRLDVWRKLGGVRGAIARHADGVLASLSGDERPLADELLLRLSATDGTPVSWSEDDLIETFGAEGAAARRVLDVLVREHLGVRRDRTIAAGHEALLKSWPHLTTARLSQMARLTFLERLREARVAWERADRPRDLLLQGALFDDLGAHPEWSRRGLTEEDRAFVRASKKGARWRTARRAAMGLAGVLMVAAAVTGKRRVDAAQEAEGRARAAAIELERTAEITAKSRRTEEPFRRAAYIAAAMDRGSTDGMLPLDLASAASNVARADFLTLEHVTGPEFPWDDRFLLAQTSGGTLTVVDFHPKEADVIEDLDLDADPEAEASKHFRKPHVLEVRPHADPIAERLAFGFDTSFVTRSVTGEVKVFRLREDGAPALAAIAPVRCSGAMRLAESAPVLACATDQGIARWDLRKARSNPGAAVDVHHFQGSVADVSADGERVAATEGARVLMWAPSEKREAMYAAEAPVTIARWSPRDQALAVVEAGGFELVSFPPAAPGGDAARAGPPLFREALGEEPASARWDEGGLDLAICDGSGEGRWFYLRSGARSKDDPPPKSPPCVPPAPEKRPRELRKPADYDELALRDLGRHSPLGGWRLGHHRYLTRELMVFDATGPAAARLLRFQGRDEVGGEEHHERFDSPAAVERDESVAAWEIAGAGEVRLYNLADGNRLLGRPGHLLRRCPDGRFLIWRADGALYRVEDLRSGAAVAAIPRAPGLVLGAGPTCKALYTQRLDGTIVENRFGGPSRDLAVADGYIYDARPAAARDGFAPGLWLAASSGAVARLDETTGAVHIAGYATPRAAALIDGAHGGNVAYVDAGGVFLLFARGGVPSWHSERVLESTGESPWEDLAMSNDGSSMLLVSGERIDALDVTRREIVGSMPTEGKSRFSRWDDDGSVLAWGFDRTGGAEGQVIPRGVPLAKLVAATASNLRADRGKLTIAR